MWLATGIALLGSLAAPGDIHRCASTDGSVHYQELPCPGARQQARLTGNRASSRTSNEVGGDEVANPAASQAATEAKLRRWLEELKRKLPPPRAPTPASDPPRRSRSGIPPITIYPSELPPRPPGEPALASCSALFLDCAHSIDAKMDQCVAGISQCPAGQTGACCHRAYVQRYELMREAGASRKLAVRDALLRD